MIIGIPKEILTGEKRVSAIPETVKKLVDNGHQVLIEKNAGLLSFYEDNEYIKSGGIILDNPKDIYSKSDIILKVKEPQYNSEFDFDEVEALKENQVLITFLHPASPVNHKMIEKLAAKGVIGLTLDGIPRISRAQSMDALSSMSTCAGYKGMLMAANRLAKFMPMVGSAVGMVRPANVLVIGAGVAGLRAISTARGLGASVSVMDIREDANEQAKSLGARVIDLEIPKKVSVSKDGFYAEELPPKWLEHERDKIREVIKDMDIVFLTALVFGKEAPILVDKEMVESMKPGSVIVDVSIDQGGNCSLTKAGEGVTHHGIYIDGTKNLPGLIPTTSTWMFANNVYNLVDYLIKDNKLNLDLKDEITKSIIVTNKGKIVHKGTLDSIKKAGKLWLFQLYLL